MLIRQRQPRTKIDLNKRIKNVARTTFQKNAWYIVNTDLVFIFLFFFLLLWSKNVAQYSCVHAKQLSNATKPKAKGQKIDIDQNPKMYRRKTPFCGALAKLISIAPRFDVFWFTFITFGLLCISLLYRGTPSEF